MTSPDTVRAADRRGRRRPRRDDLVPFSEEAAARTAAIMGENSACALALAELRRRRAAGEDVALFKVPCMILVGPSTTGPSAADDGGRRG